MKRTLADAARVMSATLHGEDRPFGPVSSDTRTLEAGDLFVALRGPHFDANEFVPVAAQRLAAGAVVERLHGISLPQLLVRDSLSALTALARAWRGNFSLPLIGVGGSNGKTTVKEMTASIMSQVGSCLATRGNLNNHIGVPLTLMRLNASHASAVIEMGANHAGDIAGLCALARPTVGLVTNAGAEHLEGFGSLEGAARAEGEMFSALAGDATCVINADDSFAPLWRELAGARRTVTFGMTAGSDFSARELRQRIDASGAALEFTLIAPDGERRVCMRLVGRHNASNALAAVAAACAAGAGLEACVRGLETVRAVRGRLEIKTAANGAAVIDDSYNDNPSSLRAAIDLLHEVAGGAWLVLGDMAELGDFAIASHKDAGRYARANGVARLFAVGELSRHAVDTFGAGAEWFADTDALTERLARELPPNATVLIKGSRVNRLERVVEALARAPYMKTA
jgi:UDP-N-acetylmuramoyl-tripeptide--D-alanyl-D-alanine ligase